MTKKRIKRQKLGGFGANFLEENLERAILTREILIVFLFFIYPWIMVFLLLIVNYVVLVFFDVNGVVQVT